MRQLAIALSLALVSTDGVHGQVPHQVELSVAGGKVDLTDVIVHVPLPDSARDTIRKLDTEQAKLWELKDASGNSYPAQLSFFGRLMPQPRKEGDSSGRLDLCFVLPRLKAGSKVALTAAPVAAPPKKRPSPGWTSRVGGLNDWFEELKFGDRPVLRYIFNNYDDETAERRNQTCKVYHHVYDPLGNRLMTNGTDGKYPHERGLFYGFGRISYDGKSADLWHCTHGAHQVHQERANESFAYGPLLGRHQAKIGWHGTDKKVFAIEHREMTVYNRPGGMLIEFASRLSTSLEKVTLDGDPQTSGFHFRAAAEVEAMSSKQTYFLRPDGMGKPGQTRNWDPKTRKGPVNLPWDAMSFVLGGRRYTVVYLDHAENPKPSRFSERAYGRIGSSFEHELTPEKPLFVRYRIWLQDGEMNIKQCEALSRTFVAPVKVAVK